MRDQVILMRGGQLYGQRIRIKPAVLERFVCRPQLAANSPAEKCVQHKQPFRAAIPIGAAMNADQALDRDQGLVLFQRIRVAGGIPDRGLRARCSRSMCRQVCGGFFDGVMAPS